MNRALQSVKNIFKRGPRGVTIPPPGSYPTNFGGERKQQPFDTVTKPSRLSDEEDDDIEDDEDIQTERAYNIRQQTQIREQQRNTIQSADFDNSGDPYGSGSTPPLSPLSPPDSTFRNNSGGFLPGLPASNDQNSKTNIMNPRSTPVSQTAPTPLSQIRDLASRAPLNPPPPSNHASQSSLSGVQPGINASQPAAPAATNRTPTPLTGFPPGMNASQPAAHAPTSNAPPSFGGFPPGMNASQPAAPAPAPTSNAPASFGGFPPGMNTSQSNLPAPMNFAGFPPGMNGSQAAPTGNATAPLAGFPPGLNMNQSTQPPANNNSATNVPQFSSAGPPSGMLTNNANNAFNDHLSSFRSQSNYNHNADSVSRLELEYPIENVLIDANIPSAVAIKVNDAVERDRLGNNHVIRRYTFEPPSKTIAFRNSTDHLIDPHSENSRHIGIRHIREISPDGRHSPLDEIDRPRRSSHRNQHRRHHSQAPVDRYVDELLRTPGRTVFHVDNSNALQQILGQSLFTPQIFPTEPLIFPSQSNFSSVQEPINYFVARALPYDPMRIL